MRVSKAVSPVGVRDRQFPGIRSNYAQCLSSFPLRKWCQLPFTSRRVAGPMSSANSVHCVRAFGWWTHLKDALTSLNFSVRSLKRLLLHKVDWGCQNRMNIDDLKHHESRMLCLKFISPLKAHQSHIAHWGTLELLCQSFGILLRFWQIIFPIQSGMSGHVKKLEPALKGISYLKIKSCPFNVHVVLSLGLSLSFLRRKLFFWMDTRNALFIGWKFIWKLCIWKMNVSLSDDSTEHTLHVPDTVVSIYNFVFCVALQ